MRRSYYQFDKTQLRSEGSELDPTMVRMLNPCLGCFTNTTPLKSGQKWHDSTCERLWRDDQRSGIHYDLSNCDFI